jgi:aromatic-L-amino-acid decarboxylase
VHEGAPPTRERPALAEREAVLAALGEVITAAWGSFDVPRPEEPPIDAELAARLREPLPEAPDPVAAALDDAARALDASVSPARPLYLAYIGSTGLEVGVLAEALAATYDVNLATTAGGADFIERQALEWTAQFVGFPLAEGAFTSGGMTSNLTALLAARERALPGAREHGVGRGAGAVYCSDEAHHSVVRAVEAAGLGRAAIRRIALDAQRRMRVDALAAALERDAAAGVVPVAVVANGGTTLTGAIDPLDPIADVCAAHGAWLHVDGAYGLPAAGTATRGERFHGLPRAHSATLDAHKWLGVQKSCSLVLVRERGALEAAFGHEERYMLHDAEHHANPVDLTLEYSRPFRSLKLWLAFRVHGAAALRTGIEHTIGLAERFAALVAADDEFELLHEPALSTVNFAHRTADNQALAAAVQADGRVYLAAAEVDGRTCLRVCFVNFRTTEEEVEFALGVVRSLAARPAA